MAGLPVPDEIDARAALWLDAVAAGPGRHLYAYQPGQGPSPAMTAEALLARQYLGLPRDDPGLPEAIAYLQANPPKWETRNTYYWYYATQVLFHLQGDPWLSWNGTLRDMLVDAQVHDGHPAGSWHPRTPHPDPWADRGGRLYETALSLLILEVYYRHLPLYRSLGIADAE